MVNIENSSFISYQALNDYMAGNQNEALLGVDADLLLQYEAHINDNYYYIIMADGSVQTLELPPDPEEKASIWERIWMGLIAVTGVVLGVMIGSIPGIGPFLSGAIIGASIDLFMQVTISGVAVDNIDWVSVGASAVTGVLTAGIGSATSAATKAALAGVKNVVAKFFIEAGIQLASGLVSGAISYITTAGIKGEPITMEGLVKALIVGGVTAVVMFCGQKAIKAIANKLRSNKITPKKAELNPEAKPDVPDKPQLTENQKKYQRSKAVKEAWERERKAMLNGEETTYQWKGYNKTTGEVEYGSEAWELLTNGKVKGYDGCHIIDVSRSGNNINLIGNPDNIVFLPRFGENSHFYIHGNNWKNATDINKLKNIYSWVVDRLKLLQ